MRTMGLDVGDKRIGVALSDAGGSLAYPLKAIERSTYEVDLSVIEALAKEHDVASIVVGLPISLNGSLGPQAEKVQEFTRRLSQRMSVPITTYDERFSTTAAERLLIERKLRRQERKGRRDAAAAALVLQAYLDAMRSGNA